MPSRGPWDPKPDPASRIDDSPSVSPTGPILHEARSTWLAYETFYGLREKPFSLSSDSRFFYHSGSHAPAFDYLLAGIRRRESLSVLTGDIGTGKTTLCRAVLENLDRTTFSAFVPDPFASREDLLKVLLMDFGVMSVDDLTSSRLKSASRTELSYLLYEFLGTLAPLQAFVVVVIDEAQNLSVPLLEEIRILSDSDGRERQLQVVLVGQLELREKLKLPEMRQVDQRVSVRCSLGPLSRDEVGGYVAHRLQVAGGSADGVKFSPDAIEVVYRVSGGVPRLINRICDRALYEGYHRGAAVIERAIVEAAIRNVDRPASAVKPNSAQRGNEWLTFGDLDTKIAPWPHVADVADPAPPISVPETPVWSPATRVTSVPRLRQTNMQGFARRWLRWSGIAALVVIALGIARAGAVYVQERNAPVTLPVLPRTPASPPMAAGSKIPILLEATLVIPPAAGSYIIEVALFNSQGRADRLVEELSSAGYRAYQTAFRGNRQQVLIGPYATRADAEFDLGRVHLMPAYQDARIVEKSPSANGTP
jgi:type II secretory pathway predicted ATPase ExeA